MNRRPLAALALTAILAFGVSACADDHKRPKSKVTTTKAPTPGQPAAQAPTAKAPAPAQAPKVDKPKTSLNKAPKISTRKK